MFKELSRDDILTELAVIQSYIDKIKDAPGNKDSLEELEAHRDELIESLKDTD